MREIKFRGRVKKDNPPQYKKGQIVYGYPVKGENTYIHTEEEFYSAVVSMGWQMCTSVVLVEDQVEQYTGLKDKNGVEIYEGDIVKVKNKLNDRVGEYNTEIIYDKGMFKLKENKTIFKDGYFWLSEVIGNTHENEDLLK